MKLLVVILTLAISASGRNFGGFTGLSLEKFDAEKSRVESDQTENEVGISTPSQDSNNGGQQFAYTTSVLSPWSAWMNMKAPPMGFLKPEKLSPQFYTAPGGEISVSKVEEAEAPWISLANMKTVNTVPSTVQGLTYSSSALTDPESGLSPTSQYYENILAKERTSSLPATRILTPSTSESMPVYNVSEYIRKYLQPVQIPTTSQLTEVGPTVEEAESEAVDSDISMQILKAYLKTMPLPNKEGSTIVAPVVNGIFPQAPTPANSPMTSAGVTMPQSNPLVPLSSTFPQFARPASIDPIIPQNSYNEVIPGVSESISGIILKYENTPLARIPLSQASPSISPEEIPSVLNWLQAEQLKNSPELNLKPVIASELSIEAILQKATPSEKILLLSSPELVEFIKSKLQVENTLLDPSAVAISPDSSIAKPELPSLTPSVEDLSVKLSPNTPNPALTKPSIFPWAKPTYPYIPLSVDQSPTSTSFKYPTLALTPQEILSSYYAQIGPIPPTSETQAIYDQLYQSPSLTEITVPQLTDPATPTPVGINKTNGLMVAEDKLLVKWAKKIFEMQKNNTWLPTNKPSIVESAWIDWLSLHNMTNVPYSSNSPNGTEPINPRPPTVEEVKELIDWLEAIDAIPANPEQMVQLVEWLVNLEIVPASVEVPVEMAPPVPLLPARFSLSYSIKDFPIPTNQASPALINPEFSAPPEVKAYLEYLLLENGLPTAPGVQALPSEGTTSMPFLMQTEKPEYNSPQQSTTPFPGTFLEWLQANTPTFERVTSIPMKAEASAETPVTGLEELTPAQFNTILKAILEQCNKKTVMVPRTLTSSNNKGNDSSEEVEKDLTDMRRALYPSQSLGPESTTLSTIQSKLNLIPQELWDLVPTVAPNTTILDQGYWAAKKSMFISKLFDALARVTLNYTNEGTTTETPQQKLIKQIDTILLSDVARSIKAKEHDSEETSTDDEDLINSDEPENLPKEPENPLHKLFKFGVQKTILSDLSTTNSPPYQPPTYTFPTTTSPVAPTRPSLNKEKLLLDKLKSAYKSSKTHYKKAKKNKSKSKKFRKSTTTSSPIDFEELAKALLVQPSK